MKRTFTILLFLLVHAAGVWAADIHFTASVSKSEVGTSEQFEVTFTVNGNGDRFNPPSFNGFLVVGGPNVSSSMSVFNGVSSSSVAYSYVLVAVKEGTYTIGAATIQVNGKQMSTSPIKIKVVKGQGQPQNNNAGATSAQSGPDSRVTMKRPGTDIAKALFIRASADKTDVYLGEQITLTYKLYTRVALVGSQPEKLPDLNGFYSQDIKNPDQNVHWRIETYKGAKYNVADMKQTILFPERTGSITLDPISMMFVVREAAESNDDDMFGQFFGSYNDVKYSIKSLPVVIHVKPLPEAGKPEGFSGGVGKFTYTTSLDKTELKANESLTYKVTVSGKGNLKLLKAPTPAFPGDFEKYDPKTTDAITDAISGETGTRTYTYLMIPRHQGNFTIPPLKFAYFDPATGKYVSLPPSQEYHIKVNKGDKENDVVAYDGSDNVKNLNKDIRYIKTSGYIVKNSEGFYGSGLYYSLLALGPLLLIGALIYGKWYERNNSDVVKVKSRKAGKVAAKHLASAQAQLTANNTQAFYENIFKGLYGYLSDKLNIAYADLNRERIAAELKARALDETLTNELLDTLDLCDMARYAPVSGVSPQQVFDKAKNMINDIEEKL